MQRIILKQSDKKILSQYSENQKPNEACGILFGKNNQVLDIFLTENKDESPVNFTISNEQLIEGYKIAEQKKNGRHRNISFTSQFRCISFKHR